MEEPKNDYQDQDEYHLLRAQIESAFRGTAYPGDDALIDEPGCDLSADNAYELLHGKTWEQLARDFDSRVHQSLYWHNEAIYFITERAFAYYLPAYLIVTLTLDTYTDVVQPDLLFLLSASTDIGSSRLKRVVGLLTNPQIAVVLAYMEYTRSYYPGFDEEWPDIIELWTSIAVHGADAVFVENP